MASCHDMKIGQVYICEDCGVELKVVKECANIEMSAAECGCHDGDDEGGFFCCGKPLELKK